ncbi:hypothetical protein ACFL0C_02310 [Patescibacteria group bacterium]
MKRTFLFLILLIAFVFSLNKFINNFIADVYYVSAQEAAKDKDFPRARKHSRLAVKYNNKEPLYYRGYGKVLLSSQLSRSISDQLPTFKEQAYENLETAYSLNEKNLATLRNTIPLYYFLALNEISTDTGEKILDERFLEISKNQFKMLKQTYPNDLGILIDVTKYEKKLGLDNDVEKNINSAKILRPDIVEWHEVFN